MRSAPVLVAIVLLAGCGAPAGETSAATVRARVVRVVDGDTLKVRVGTKRETVRLLGIDAPESVKPDTPAQCGGRAAARALRRLALTPDGRERSVRLVADPSQARRDRFDRLLAYAELVGGATSAASSSWRAGHACTSTAAFRSGASRAIAQRSARRGARHAANGGAAAPRACRRSSPACPAVGGRRRGGKREGGEQGHEHGKGSTHALRDALQRENLPPGR